MTKNNYRLHAQRLPCVQKHFIFLHGISKHFVLAIKNHFLDNGISTREHGNTGNHPKHTLSFRTILGILQFIQNYAEQHAILLPGRIPQFKWDDVKILSSSDTRKVFLNYVNKILTLVINYCIVQNFVIYSSYIDNQDTKPWYHTVCITAYTPEMSTPQ